jgi:polyhydroxyalkanoate synthesis regulator phasin
MSRQTALTAKPLSVEERKAKLSEMVRQGKLTEEQARLVDFRDVPEAIFEEARKLGPAAKRALTRSARRKAA